MSASTPESLGQTPKKEKIKIERTPTRVSSRENKGQHPTRYINEAFLSLVAHSTTYSHEQALVYNDSIVTDVNSGIINFTDPRAYTAKTRSKRDQENPSFHETMHREYEADYQRTMVTEVKELMRQKTLMGQL